VITRFSHYCLHNYLLIEYKSQREDTRAREKIQEPERRVCSVCWNSYHSTRAREKSMFSQLEFLSHTRAREKSMFSQLEFLSQYKSQREEYVQSAGILITVQEPERRECSYKSQREDTRAREKIQEPERRVLQQEPERRYKSQREDTRAREKIQEPERRYNRAREKSMFSLLEFLS
ncbi:hypothetical protein L9F63_020169, partial [Diploptera punctata]